MASASGTTVAPDDNLVPGQTYTFVLKLLNYITDPGQSKVQAEILQNAPNFLGSLMVQAQSGLSPFTTYYNVTFTYTGDGSDVASDVAAAIIAACAAGTGSWTGGDNFELVSMNSGAVGESIQTDVSKIATGAGKTVGDALGGAAAAATSNVSFDVLLVVVGLVALGWVLFEFGGVSGVKARLA